jgi:uncharacterized protein (TIGR02391 family)
VKRYQFESVWVQIEALRAPLQHERWRAAEKPRRTNPESQSCPGIHNSTARNSCAARRPSEFHSAIAQVSGQLFRDGHYKQAALEAYIRVIDEVKRKSGLVLDGDSLVNRAFGCENQTPVIQFNTLQTDAERDEQKGIMFLFKGIVGLRNSKAHSNRLFNDPRRAHEYLALASLLMRLLEIAAVNRTP